MLNDISIERYKSKIGVLIGGDFPLLSGGVPTRILDTPDFDINSASEKVRRPPCVEWKGRLVGMRDIVLKQPIAHNSLKMRADNMAIAASEMMTVTEPGAANSNASFAESPRDRRVRATISRGERSCRKPGLIKTSDFCHRKINTKRSIGRELSHLHSGVLECETNCRVATTKIARYGYRRLPVLVTDSSLFNLTARKHVAFSLPVLSATFQRTKFAAPRMRRRTYLNLKGFMTRPAFLFSQHRPIVTHAVNNDPKLGRRIRTAL